MGRKPPAMNTGQWQASWRIFNAARELPASEQRSFVESECADAEVVQRVIEELDALRNAENAGDPEPHDCRTGALVGRYRVEELLGRGGMGEVYAARDTELNRPVALKFLLPQALADAKAAQRFVHEAKAASALNHPNILTIHEVIDSSSGLAITMELVEGVPLRSLRGSPLTSRQVVEIGRQVAAALAAAHAQSIVHRDIKPENVMLRPDGIVKVLDFGLAKSFEGEGRAPLQTALSDFPAGTLRYMSPEQLRNERLTGASDIYSLGLVLYELIAGAHPFESSYAWETAHGIHTRNAQPVAKANPEAPQWLNELIASMLDRDAALRPTAAELEAALSNESWKERGAAPHRGFWKLAIAAILLTSAATLGWSWFHTAPLSRPSVTVFTEYPGDEDMPSFSPDGQSVAFVWNGPAQDNFDIYIRKIGSKSLRRITSSPLQDFSPAWSPDGQSVAFLRKSPRNGSVMLFLVPVDGGPEKRIADISLDVPELEPFLSWTPDGKSLVAPGKESERDHVGLFLVSPKDGTSKRLTRPPEEQVDLAPAMSPDGRTLAFMRSHGQGSQRIYLLRLTATFLSGGEPEPVPALFNVFLSTPQWTADGKELLFVANPKPGIAIWRMRLPEPGKPWESPHPETYVGRSFGVHLGAPSAAAHRLMYSIDSQQRSIWLKPLGGASRETLPPKRIGPTSETSSDGHISPDGSRIVYQSTQTGATEIWVSNIDGTNALQLTNFGGPGTGSPSWSPDGQRIAFDSRMEGRAHIYVIPVTGGNPERVTDVVADNYLPEWSKDGHWIYYCSTRSGTIEVWRQPVAGGTAQQLTQGGGWAPAESPDGRSLFFQRRMPGGWSLRQLNLSTGIDREVVPGMVERAYGVARDGVYYIPSPAKNGRFTIQFYSFESKASQSIATILKPMARALSLAPDASFLLYSQLDHWGEDLVLVNNFH